MRILLDESLPKGLQFELPGHEVRTVQEMGWSSLKNGELLARSVNRFDVFLTADQNLRYQQNLSLEVRSCLLHPTGSDLVFCVKANLRAAVY